MSGTGSSVFDITQSLGADDAGRIKRLLEAPPWDLVVFDEAHHLTAYRSGAKVTKTENWGLRTLAYKIEKNRKGHYVLIECDAPATAVHEVERTLRLNEDVLRHMTIRLDELSKGPSKPIDKSPSENEFEKEAA